MRQATCFHQFPVFVLSWENQLLALASYFLYQSPHLILNNVNVYFLEHQTIHLTEYCPLPNWKHHLWRNRGWRGHLRTNRVYICSVEASVFQMRSISGTVILNSFVTWSWIPTHSVAVSEPGGVRVVAGGEFALPPGQIPLQLCGPSCQGLPQCLCTLWHVSLLIYVLLLILAHRSLRSAPAGPGNWWADFGLCPG